MDNTQQPSLAEKMTQEMSHVAEELYKKNLQLDQTNKILSLLQKINSIILSKVTDMQQIAQQVTDALATEEEFQTVTIFLTDKKKQILSLLATAQTETVKKIQAQYNKTFTTYETKLSKSTHPLIKTLNEKTVQILHTFDELLSPVFKPEEIKVITGITGDTSCMLYPLVVREEAIGVMAVCFKMTESSVPEYQKELLNRLVPVVGIAIDNALLYESITEANEHLRQLDQLKDDFISLASHELNNPLGSMKMIMYDLMHGKTGEITPQQRHSLEIISSCSTRLIAMIGDMLNVSRIVAGRLIIQPKPVSLEAITGELVEEAQIAAQQQHITLTVMQPDHPLPLVLADKYKIIEVIMNLITNALKFTPAEGKITISFSEKENMVITHVADTGKGITKEDEPKLFKKFGMIEGKYEKLSPGQGTGLGLYVAKSIIIAHGGSIWFESEGENKGTTFSFSLKKA